MNIRARIKALEAKVPRPPCPACAVIPKLVYVEGEDDLNNLPPHPARCPVCGGKRIPLLIVEQSEASTP